MAVLVSAHEVSKAFGVNPLFEDLTFSIDSQDRIGLIGPNGAGKSTLLKMIAGQHSPDRGTLSFSKGLKIGYLSQSAELEDSLSIMDNILLAFKASPSAQGSDWNSQSIAEEWISKLGLNQDGRSGETIVGQLSGGWKKRVALARELAKNPELLLLDEPTNHLDIDSIFWLEDFLARSSIAQLIVSHDRVFLENVVNRMIEVDRRNPGGLISVRGKYSDFLIVKEEGLARLQGQEVRLKNTLRRETEWLRRGAKARTTKQQARINRHGDLVDQVQDLTYRNHQQTLDLNVQAMEKSPKRLVELKKVSKVFGEKCVLDQYSLLLSAGRKIGLLGANGCGKTTLIKVLLGQTQVDQGEVWRSDLLQAAYFDQKRENLDLSLTVLKTLCPTGETVEFIGTKIHVRGYLSRFLFTQGQMDMSVSKLSGGEQSRLLIAKLFLQPMNLLILDEPTNDLDLQTLDILQDVLLDFKGAIVLVTHDRYFMDQVCDTIYGFGLKPDGKPEMVPFAGLEQWKDWNKGRSKVSRRTTPVEGGSDKNSASVKNQSFQNVKRKKLSYNDQRDYDSIEQRIAVAEQSLGELELKSQEPNLGSNAIELGKLTDKMGKLHQEIEALYTRWSRLEELQNSD